VYRGAIKSLARPGRKQTRKLVRDARDFNNIETRALIKFFFPSRQGAEGNSRHSDRNISVFFFLVGLRTYQHPFTGVIRTNKMPLSVLIYFNNLSSTYFKWSNHSSSGGRYYICSTLIVLAASHRRRTINTVCAYTVPACWL